MAETTPDSWDDDKPSNTTECSGSDLSDLAAGLNLNVHAKPFVPNINAPAFVPSFLPPTASTPPGETTVSEGGDGDSEGTDNTEVKQDEPVATPTEDTDDSATGPGSWDQADESTPSSEPTSELDSARGSPQDESPPEFPLSNGSSAVKVKKKVAEVEEIPKEHVNVVFIGHVDAGKSTIGGHIMYLTGMVDKRTLEKYEREAKEKNRETWYLSWALDTNQEERDKGKTVEVGRAFFETESKHFTILDAPGHKSFVPNMIGGAAQSDLAVLVISARKGEFETGFEKGGQTREHAMLAKTAGVRHLVLLINKMDDPTVEWSEERFEECKEKLTPFLKKLGFNPKKDIFYIPVSGLTGANLRTVVDESVCPWYRGPAFIPYIDGLPAINRKADGPIRLPVSDKYKDMGTVVMGKLESGTITKGASLVMMPNKVSVEILQLFSDDDEKNITYAGENIKIRLKGIEDEDISKGFVVCDAQNICHASRVFDAQVVILEYKSIICPGYSAVMHCHTCIEEVQLKQIICLIDKKTGDKSKKRPRFIKQDQVAIARFEAAGAICLETFKDFPQMGRFTLRDEGKTIAIGKILKLTE